MNQNDCNHPLIKPYLGVMTTWHIGQTRSERCKQWKLAKGEFVFCVECGERLELS